MVLGQVGFGELQVSKLSSAVSCSRPRNQDLNTASKVTDVSEDSHFSVSGIVSKKGNLGGVLSCYQMH